MRNIDHLSDEEKEHYILCECGHYIDMRSLSDVFDHLHMNKTVSAQWSHSGRVGEQVIFTKYGKRIDLN
jgi:hypothetical protein